MSTNSSEPSTGIPDPLPVIYPELVECAPYSIKLQKVACVDRFEQGSGYVDPRISGIKTSHCKGCEVGSVRRIELKQAAREHRTPIEEDSFAKRRHVKNVQEAHDRAANLRQDPRKGGNYFHKHIPIEDVIKPKGNPLPQGRTKDPLPKRKCRFCGELFQPARENSHHCSRECRWKETQAKKNEGKPPKPRRVDVIESIAKARKKRTTPATMIPSFAPDESLKEVAELVEWLRLKQALTTFEESHPDVKKQLHGMLKKS